MGWEGINLNLLHASDFSVDAQNLVLRVFDTATNALDEEWKRYQKDFKTEYARTLEDWEATQLSQELDWEEYLHRQRMQGVGALALDWLMYSLQTALHGAKRYLDSSHPSQKAYKGDGWLERAYNEYQQRFGIDFGKATVPFLRIQELVLARNAGIHRDEGNMKEYLKKIEKPVFVDNEDRFFVSREALVPIIKDCEQFIKWVVAEIEKLRPARKAEPSLE